jgi:ribosomal protein S18 acetylase RimI-like enzyme
MVTAVRPASARLAATGDTAVLTALRQAALSEQATLRGGAVYSAREARSLPEVGEADHPLWVGVLAGEVVGYLAARTDDLASAGRLGVIESLYVAPPCRAVGVGEAMMAEALVWFGTQGCAGVDAIALPGARATKNFFEESGFTSRLLVMHHRL